MSAIAYPDITAMTADTTTTDTVTIAVFSMYEEKLPACQAYPKAARDSG